MTLYYPAMPRLLKLLTAPLVILTTLLMSGCAAVGYTAQAVSGGLGVNLRARHITDVLNDDRTPPRTRERLRLIADLRVFAETTLHLDPGGNYRSYTDLGRAHVVWNVIATPEFSLEPRRFCVPFAGCFGYKGYFSEKGALREAKRYRRRGDDVTTYGVSAYSTLGYLRDPVLSSFLFRSEPELAALLFHELAHKRLYVRGDTAFNESFATVVEEEGVRRWLALRGDGTGEHAQFQKSRVRRAAFVALVNTARARLAGIYAAGGDAEGLRARKARTFSQLRADYLQLKSDWNGDAHYDGWFAQDLNNAHLASVGLYHQHAPALRALLRHEGDDLQRFYHAAVRLGRLTPEARQRALDRF